MLAMILNPISREISFQKYILHCTNRQLGKEKLEVIAYCKINIYIFETNDSKARDFDKREGVIVLSRRFLKPYVETGLKGKNKILKIIQFSLLKDLII